MCSVAVAAEARGVNDCIVVDHSSSVFVAFNWRMLKRVQAATSTSSIINAQMLV